MGFVKLKQEQEINEAKYLLAMNVESWSFTGAGKPFS